MAGKGGEEEEEEEEGDMEDESLLLLSSEDDDDDDDAAAVSARARGILFHFALLSLPLPLPRPKPKPWMLPALQAQPPRRLRQLRRATTGATTGGEEEKPRARPTSASAAPQSAHRCRLLLSCPMYIAAGGAIRNGWLPLLR